MYNYEIIIEDVKKNKNEVIRIYVSSEEKALEQFNKVVDELWTKYKKLGYDLMINNKDVEFYINDELCTIVKLS